MLNRESQVEYRPGNQHLRLYIKAPTSRTNWALPRMLVKSNTQVLLLRTTFPSKEELIKAMEDDRNLQKLIACVHAV